MNYYIIFYKKGILFLNKIILAIIFMSQIQAIEIVDSYLKQGEVRKALNRIYFLAKDKRNFTCTKFRLNCIRPNDIVKKIIQVREKSLYKKEKEVIDNFFVQQEIQNNIFITSYLHFLDFNYSESEYQLNKILIDYPSNLYALKQKLAILNITGDFNRTKYILQKLVEIEPENPTSYFQLISLYLYQKDKKFAKSMFEITKKKFPHHNQLQLYKSRIDEMNSFWTTIFGTD